MGGILHDAFPKSKSQGGTLFCSSPDGDTVKVCRSLSTRFMRPAQRRALRKKSMASSRRRAGLRLADVAAAKSGPGRAKGKSKAGGNQVLRSTGGGSGENVFPLFGVFEVWHNLSLAAVERDRQNITVRKE